jgi:LmbE family N-acetylglucosaminyl deacetylase
MKPTPSSLADPPSVLVFGAHPDDIEFGCGGVIAQETRGGRAAHFVVCSRGEAATHGQPEQRVAEAQRAAALLGATIEFVEFDGDSHLEVRTAHAITLAGVVRRVRPARFGGVQELSEWPPHAIAQSEPDNISPVLIDISPPEIISAWVAAMEAHASQTSARNYVELQIARARLHGLGAAVEYATALFPADPLLFTSLSGLGRGARGF